MRDKSKRSAVQAAHRVLSVFVADYHVAFKVALRNLKQIRQVVKRASKQKMSRITSNMLK